MKTIKFNRKKLLKNRQLKICVIGAWRNYSKEAKRAAIEVGEWIGENNHIIITGACLGIPNIAAISCKKKGGKSIGFSPANSPKYHITENGLTNEGFDEIIYMNSEQPLSYAQRNIVNITNADIVILISGRMGTINEYTIAHDMEKPIGVIEGVGEASNIARNIELVLYGKTKSKFAKNINLLMVDLIK